jgi:RNA polymerase sigma-70 factor (ECF subfamily)
MMYRIAARGCRNAALAEEAVQEGLTLAYQKLDRYEPGTSLKAFLAAFAARQAHTLLRSEARRRVREEGASAPEELASPSEVLAAERLAERIRKSLAGMPQKRRTAALLYLDGKLSHREIASAIGSSEGSARVLVHGALKQLRTELADLVGDQP